jgi:hypothetical protein
MIYSQDAGIDNALKLREIFNKEPIYRGRAVFQANISDVLYDVRVELMPWNGVSFDNSIRTYRFSQDGTYTSHVHY